MAVTKISNSIAKAMCDAAVDALDVSGPGLLRIYSGSAPANADDAASGTLLAELTLNATAFGAAADLNPGARATANAITGDTSANATGTAGYFRLVRADGTFQIQGDVTATGGGGALELNTTSIVAGVQVDVTSLTFTMPES